MTTSTVRRVLLSAQIIGAFILIRFAFWLRYVPGWSAFDTHHREPAMLVWKLAQAGLCVLAVMLIWRVSPREALDKLGLGGSIRQGLGFSLAVTAPMLIVLCATSTLNPNASVWSVLRTTVGSGVSEEMLYRGLLFLLLYREARWPFWLAVLSNAAPFAYGHLYQSTQTGLGLVSGLAEVVVVVGLSAVLICWVLIEWNDNLWIAIGIHAFMNGWWILFGEGGHLIFGWVGNVVRFGTLFLIVVATLVRRRRRTGRVLGAERSQASHHGVEGRQGAGAPSTP